MKAPILSRELFYTRLRDGSFLLLPWAIVNTSIGAMVESVPLALFGTHKVTDVDVYDLSFTSIRQLQEDEVYKLTQVGGQQLPVNYNTQ